MNEHTNHRQRLKNRFISQGLSGFDDHQILELLLFYAIPRIDTNPIAHRLLNEFGSLNGVLSAPYEKLILVEGVGEGAATFLKLLMEFDRKLGLEKIPQKEGFNNLDKVGKYLINLYKGENSEKAYLLCFNGKMELIKTVLLSTGTTSATSIPLRTIVENTFESSAAAIILAHNHPTGYCTPSESDLYMTEQLRFFTNALQINFLEHIVVADNKFFPIVASTQKIPKETFKI